MVLTPHLTFSPDVFFSICLALMVASLLETIIVTNILHNSKDYRAVPRWVRVLVLEFMARLVCLPQKKTDQVIIFQNQGIRLNCYVHF